MQNRNCEFCGTKKAEVLIVRAREGMVDHTVLCNECVRERSRVLACHCLDLKNVLEAVEETKCADRSKEGCKVCGAVISEITEAGRPGCPNCYDHFNPALMKLIADIQNHTCHVGKTPLE